MRPQRMMLCARSLDCRRSAHAIVLSHSEIHDYATIILSLGGCRSRRGVSSRSDVRSQLREYCITRS